MYVKGTPRRLWSLWHFVCLQENLHSTFKPKIFPSANFEMSKILTLPNVTMEDKGLYHCRAELDPTIYKDVSRRVSVYGECALDRLKIIPLALMW